MLKYDVAVIGAGSGGISAAHGLKKAGKSVAIFENYLWGGTCANMGCDPKKIIVSAVDVLREAQLLQGEVEGQLKLNWQAVMAKKQDFVDKMPESSRRGLEVKGIDTYEETPRFINENTVELPNGEQVQAETWIIATGKKPALPTFEGADLAGNSEDFLNLAEMPEDITFIGGGYIAIEFASISHFAGAKVHLLHHNNRMLKAFDAWLVDELTDRMEEQGIDLQFDTAVQSLTEKDGRILVKTTDGDEFLTDKVFVATGRVAAIEGLDLEKASVKADKSGIRVNEHLQTTNPKIYAVGDVADSGVPNLTPVAGHEARYLVNFLTGKTRDKISYPAISSAVFAHPRIAQVGVNSDEAREKGYQIVDYDLSPWFNYLRRNDQAKARIILSEADGKIVGVSLISEQADEIINMFVEAINSQWTVKDVQNRIITYPTMESDLQYFYIIPENIDQGCC